MAACTRGASTEMCPASAVRSRGLQARELAQATEPALGRGGAQLLDYLAHHHVLLQLLVALLDRAAAAAGDALATLAVNERVVIALGGGHRVDDGLHALEAGFVHLGVLRNIGERAKLGQHTDNLLERAHLA